MPWECGFSLVAVLEESDTPAPGATLLSGLEAGGTEGRKEALLI